MRKANDILIMTPLYGERQQYETDAAIQACNTFLRLGPKRTIRILANLYKTQAANAQALGLPSPSIPTESHSTLRGWQTSFKWADRASVYDSNQEAMRQAAHEEVMRQGFAQPHERVHALNELGQGIMEELNRRSLYGKKRRSVGSGDNQEFITERFFRKEEVNAFRGVLSDLADETGGRRGDDANATQGGMAGLLAQAESWDEQFEDAVVVSETTEKKER